MSTTTIKIWRGLRTIGGNIAEIRYGKDRIIFDFGLVFDPAGALLDSQQGRGKTYTHDLLRLGLIPPIDGIYSKTQLRNDSLYEHDLLTAEESEWNTAVFISHLHLDHMGAIRTISPTVPIYMSEESIALYKVLMTIGEEPKHNREFQSLNGSTTIQVGKITITPYYVDHDVTGALSLLIQTPDASIVYSGDFRMHGQYPERNEYWLGEVSKEDIDVLFVEGTNFRPIDIEKTNNYLSESDISQELLKYLESTEGIAIFNIYHRNIDRIQTMIDGARSAGRKVVFELETAYIADQLLQANQFYVLDSECDKLEEWQKRLYKKYPSITVEEINASPKDYFIQNSFHQLMNLLDYQSTNSLYIHSNGVPLGEFDPNYGKLQSFLERLHVTHQLLDVSGHASTEDVLQVIEEIQPNILIPWHSHYPELIQPKNKKQVVFLPENEVTYKYEQNKLMKVEK